MPQAAINAYIERLPDRKDELKTLLAGPSLLPWMDQGGREKTLNSWQKRHPERIPAKLLPALGIAVQYIPKE